MKVKIHTLFRYLLETTAAEPEAILGFSLSTPPRLGAFLDALDPAMPLDWNGRDFYGMPELRARVLAQAGLEGACGIGDVLITAGAAEANYLVLRQLLEPGDELVVELPGWPQAPVLAEAQGARLRTVRRDAARGWALDLGELSEAVGPRTRAIFLTSPNNPTGRCLGAAELEAIAGIAARVGAWLIVDEVYAGLEWSAPRAPSVAGLYERGITTGSVSKALGLQGLRCGWLICRDAGLLTDALVLRENSSEIMPVLGEAIAEIALRPERLGPALAAARAEGAGNLARLDAWIDASAHLAWTAPEAGLIGLARLPDGIGSEALARRLLAPPYRTFVLPGAAYGVDDHIRLGVGGGPETRVELGLARLSACLDDWTKG